MDKVAIKQVWERLHKARKAHQQLLNSMSFEEAESAWSDFLTAASTVYSKLEKGSKGHPKSEPWFGRIKNERKTDPLLTYIHHARNTDEHGIVDVTKRVHGRTSISSTGGGVHIKSMRIQDGEITHLDATPIGPDAKVIVERTPATLGLVPVVDDRFKDVCPVPTSHLGKDLDDGSPLEVATLALEYLNRIVRDGSDLSK